MMWHDAWREPFRERATDLHAIGCTLQRTCTMYVSCKPATGLSLKQQPSNSERPSTRSTMLATSFADAAGIRSTSSVKSEPVDRRGCTGVTPSLVPASTHGCAAPAVLNPGSDHLAAPFIAAFSVWTGCMMAPVRAVNSREECHWSNACKSFKRTCAGSNGILESATFCLKTRTVPLSS
jgi:hypothetical protein